MIGDLLQLSRENDDLRAALKSSKLAYERVYAQLAATGLELQKLKASIFQPFEFKLADNSQHPDGYCTQCGSPASGCHYPTCEHNRQDDCGCRGGPGFVCPHERIKGQSSDSCAFCRAASGGRCFEHSSDECEVCERGRIEFIEPNFKCKPCFRRTSKENQDGK